MNERLALMRSELLVLGGLLGAFSWLVVGGLGALLFGRMSPRWAARFGMGSAVVACFAGLLASGMALVGQLDVAWSLPWRMPVGSLLIGVDPLSAFFLIPMFLLAGLGAIYAAGYFGSWNGRNPGRFWLGYHTLVAGMALVMIARNGFLFLVAWEVMSVASFFLVVYEDEAEETRRAGWVYLVAAHVGVALLMALFALLGRGSGSLDFAVLGAPAGATGGLFLLALVGFGTKAGLFPLHVWLPEAHPAAPSPVSALMSGIMIKTGIYGVLRVILILGATPIWCAWVVLGLGAVTALVGILFALAQQDLKRLLAYSSVENIGIIAVGLGLGMLGLHHQLPLVAALGFIGALLHVWNHCVFKGLLFMGAGAVVHATGTHTLDELGGLLKRMPMTGLAFLVGAAAICALPPLNGFVSELLIYIGAFKMLLGSLSAAVWGVLIVVALALAGGLAAACFAKLFGIVFLGEPRTQAASDAREVAAWLRWPMYILAALCLLLGVGAGGGVYLARPVVAQLMGVAEFKGAAFLAGPVRSLLPLTLMALLVALVGMTAVWTVVRRRLIARIPVRTTVTWDCGYAAPAPTMQYTATSFTQPLTKAAALFLRSKTRAELPEDIFPGAATFAVTTPDWAHKKLYAPIFRKLAKVLSRLHWMQQGRVQWYVFYVVAALTALLVWMVWP